MIFFFADIRCGRIDGEIMCTSSGLCSFSDITLVVGLSVACQKIEGPNIHLDTGAISVNGYNAIFNPGDETSLSMKRSPCFPHD
jgi:hypothetical protein